MRRSNNGARMPASPPSQAGMVSAVQHQRLPLQQQDEAAVIGATHQQRDIEVISATGMHDGIEDISRTPPARETDQGTAT